MAGVWVLLSELSLPSLAQPVICFLLEVITSFLSFHSIPGVVRPAVKTQHMSTPTASTAGCCLPLPPPVVSATSPLVHSCLSSSANPTRTSCWGWFRWTPTDIRLLGWAGEPLPPSERFLWGHLTHSSFLGHSCGDNVPEHSTGRRGDAFMMMSESMCDSPEPGCFWGVGSCDPFP